MKDIRRYLLATRESIDPGAVSVLGGLLSDESGCDAFRVFARDNLVAPTIFAALDRYAPLPPPGARLRAAFEAEVEQQRALHHRLQLCLVDFDIQLSSRGIEFVLMKGPVYAQELYDQPRARHYGDLDILVRAADATSAMRALTEIGFVARVHPFLPQWITRTVEHGFAMTSNDLILDLHHALRTRPAYRIDSDRLWHGTRRIQIGSSNVLALSEEYEIVSAILSVAHDLERNRCRAKILIDLYLLLLRAAPGIDWETFFEMRRKENLFTISINVIAVLLLALGSPDTLADLEGPLRRHADKLAVSDLDGALSLIDERRGNGLNRRWFARVYPGRPISYRLWLMAAFFASGEFPTNLMTRLVGGR